MELKSIIHNHIDRGIEIRKDWLLTSVDLFEQVGKCIFKKLKNGGKIVLCGNGGSAADCQHIAAEFVNRFKIERNPLPAIAITTDTSIITAIGNDYSFDLIFSKQIEAICNKSDVLIAISTSGKSNNIINALKTAKERNITTIGFTGNSNLNDMNQYCDFIFNVNSQDTPQIQEIHITIGHIICLIVDHYLIYPISE